MAAPAWRAPPAPACALWPLYFAHPRLRCKCLIHRSLSGHPAGDHGVPKGQRRTRFGLAPQAANPGDATPGAMSGPQSPQRRGRSRPPAAEIRNTEPPPRSLPATREAGTTKDSKVREQRWGLASAASGICVRQGPGAIMSLRPTPGTRPRRIAAGPAGAKPCARLSSRARPRVPADGPAMSPGRAGTHAPTLRTF